MGIRSVYDFGSIKCLYPVGSPLFQSGTTVFIAGTKSLIKVSPKLMKFNIRLRGGRRGLSLAEHNFGNMVSIKRELFVVAVEEWRIKAPEEGDLVGWENISEMGGGIIIPI